MDSLSLTPSKFFELLGNLLGVFARLDPGDHGQAKKFGEIKEALHTAHLRLSSQLDRAEAVIKTTRANLAHSRLASPDRIRIDERLTAFEQSIKGVWANISGESIQELLTQRAALEAAMDSICPKKTGTR